MRRAALPLLSGLALSACASSELADDRAKMAEEAQARSEILADRFQKELLSALTAAMAAEGPQGAIGACSSIAPALAAQLSEESGASVRRTALKTRNPAAKADATEQRVMARWAAAPLDDEGRPKRWTAREGGEYRHMRAIPTMPMCLACHGAAGEELSNDLIPVIDSLYPGDKAKGYHTGDLRGMWHIVFSAAGE